MALTIENDGPEILSSDFWDSEMARDEYFFLSINAGAARLLIPDSRIGEVREMEACKLVILSRGPWPQAGIKDAIEVLFDNTDTPYSMYLVKSRWTV